VREAPEAAAPAREGGDEDGPVLDRLRAGDREAFLTLVTRYHASLVRVARAFVPNQAVAEEVAQDTWVAVLQGLDRFERRAAFRTWLFRILVNRARTTGARERRSVPLGAPEAAVAPGRFDPSGAWAAPPVPWADQVAERVTAAALRPRLRAALDDLPRGQRAVVTLRDVAGLDGDEVCQLLDLSPGNQRVLLHRGRSRLRQALASEVVAS
jgi:RNA polymerase sigma-70 factor (ECF subfamily)